MKHLFIAGLSATLLIAAPALAGSDKAMDSTDKGGKHAKTDAPGNSGAARAMAEVLSGTPGIGSAAATISGKNAIDGDPSDSGWGNAGSRLLSGDQVSRGKD